MKYILVIAGLLLFMESVNVFQWVKPAGNQSALVYDADAEEDKKAGGEVETAKFDKSNHHVDYTLALLFNSRQSVYAYITGGCLEGHPLSLYQPPDAGETSI